MRQIDNINNPSNGWNWNNKERDKYNEMLLIKFKNDKFVNELLKDFHNAISDEFLLQNSVRLELFCKERHNCSICKSYDDCPNRSKGWVCRLNVRESDDTRIYLDEYITPCKKGQAKAADKNLTIINSPDILDATFDTLDKSEASRNNIILECISFANSIGKGDYCKGLYLHGNFGIGKSFMLGAIANELKLHNVKCCFVHWSSFVQDLKGSFKDNTCNNKITSLKECPILFIDDIGAETTTPWARDEVLGTILQYRMQNKLSTCFSSNYSFEELEARYSYTQNGSEPISAKRLMERVKFLSKPILVNGHNRRNPEY